MEEMKEAEERNEFVYVRPVDGGDEEEDEGEIGEDKDKDKDDSIANLAKKIQETKLSQNEQGLDSVVEVKVEKSVYSSISKDDLDLDIDIELDNVDTTDVNLDDDLSDD